MYIIAVPVHLARFRRAAAVAVIAVHIAHRVVVRGAVRRTIAVAVRHRMEADVAHRASAVEAVQEEASRAVVAPAADIPVVAVVATGTNLLKYG